MFKKYLILNFVLLISISGCGRTPNHCSVQKSFNEFRDLRICAVSDCPLKSETSSEFDSSHEYRSTSISLEKRNDDILIYFETLASHKYTGFRADSHFLLKVYTKGENVQEIKLRALPEENKESSLNHMSSFHPFFRRLKISVVFAKITQEQILKIANAEKVTFALETFDNPIKGELNKEGLKPFQEFSQNCLMQNQ